MVEWFIKWLKFPVKVLLFFLFNDALEAIKPAGPEQRLFP